MVCGQTVPRELAQDVVSRYCTACVRLCDKHCASIVWRPASREDVRTTHTVKRSLGCCCLAPTRRSYSPCGVKANQRSLVSSVGRFRWSGSYYNVGFRSLQLQMNSNRLALSRSKCLYSNSQNAPSCRFKKPERCRDLLVGLFHPATANIIRTLNIVTWHLARHFLMNNLVARVHKFSLCFALWCSITATLAKDPSRWLINLMT